MPLPLLRKLPRPASTLQTLVKRGLVTLEERPAAFHLTGAAASGQHPLNAAQQAALELITGALNRQTFGPSLLYGVTGSGKTAVYLAAMQRALREGKSAILLVPEIGLTPAMAAQLHGAFGDNVALLHSALSPDERAEQWYQIRRGQARVVVGTRSAIFAPAQNLGLIIVDEEHDSSYKQEEIPRYHARDVAVMRAKISGAAIVLGSATPSLETYAYSASKAAVHHLTRNMAKHLARDNINVNAIAPGPFETKMLAPVLAVSRAAMESGCPRGRIGQDDDMIGAAIFYCSRASSYVTATVLPVDGGISGTPYAAFDWEGPN